MLSVSALKYCNRKIVQKLCLTSLPIIQKEFLLLVIVHSPFYETNICFLAEQDLGIWTLYAEWKLQLLLYTFNFLLCPLLLVVWNLENSTEITLKKSQSNCFWVWQKIMLPVNHSAFNAWLYTLVGLRFVLLCIPVQRQQFCMAQEMSHRSGAWVQHSSPRSINVLLYIRESI